MSRTRICAWFLLGLAIAWTLTFLGALCAADVENAALTLAFPIMLIVVEPDAVTIAISVLLLSPLLAALASLGISLVRQSKLWLIAALGLLTIYSALALLICIALALAAGNAV